MSKQQGTWYWSSRNFQKKDQRCIYSGDASYHNMLVDDNAEIVTAEKVISYVTESWEGIHELKK